MKTHNKVFNPFQGEVEKMSYSQEAELHRKHRLIRRKTAMQQYNDARRDWLRRNQHKLRTAIVFGALVIGVGLVGWMV